MQVRIHVDGVTRLVSGVSQAQLQQQYRHKSVSGMPAAWVGLTEFEQRQCLQHGRAGDECVHELWQRCLQVGNGSSPCKRNGCAQPNSPASQRTVWATLLTGNAISYTAQVLVQILSIRLFSCHTRHITLVTPEVYAEVRSRLQGAGSHVIQVEHIAWPMQPLGVIDAYRTVFAKLHLWRLGHALNADVFGFIDADTFLLTHEADGLFAACADRRADLCARMVPGTTMVQASVMLVRPSLSRYRMLLASLQRFEEAGISAATPEQAFLTHAYEVRRGMATLTSNTTPVFGKAWAKARLSARANRSEVLAESGIQLFNLGKKDGRLRGTIYEPCPKFSHLAFDPTQHQREAVRTGIAGFALWHACGASKLDRMQRCDQRVLGPNDSNTNTSFCSFRVLRLYQWLNARANPCSVHSAFASDCSYAENTRCHWCASATHANRCVPHDWRCHHRDNATRNLQTRLSWANRGGAWGFLTRPGWCTFDCDPACCANRSRKWHRWASSQLVLANQDLAQWLGSSRVA